MGAKPDNQNAEKYGGEGAIKRISEGKAFLGLAAEEQAAVENTYQGEGQAGIVESNAIRLQTALNLYWNAVQKAAAEGDLAAFDRYIARYGWLAGVTLRAWAQVAADQKDAAKGRGVSIVDVMNSLKAGDHAESE